MEKIISELRTSDLIINLANDLMQYVSVNALYGKDITSAIDAMTIIAEKMQYQLREIPTREQREAGLDLLTAEERLRLRSHNEKYRDKFGFTFIICARQNKAAAILEGLSRRLLSGQDSDDVIHLMLQADQL